MSVERLHNLRHHEPVLRVSIGLALLFFAYVSAQYWPVIIALILIYTGTFNFCPVYAITGINSKMAKENFYLSQLPKLNPEPVLLFNKEGKLEFSNSMAKNLMPDMEYLTDIDPDLDKEVLAKSENGLFQQRKLGELTYLFHVVPAKAINATATYGFNISESIAMKQEIIDTQKELIHRIGEVGESRSEETGAHVKRVAEYSYLLARLYGLNEEEAHILKMASPMHDIGKVGIPDTILKKPGKLDASEWEIMKTHSKIGYDLFKDSDRPILKAAATVAYEHHEKYDGSGYPRGLKGKSIHIYGRITAVADVFDALSNDRVYKKAWPLEKTMHLFSEESGKHFDPMLVRLLEDNLTKFLEIGERYSNDVIQG